MARTKATQGRKVQITQNNPKLRDLDFETVFRKLTTLTLQYWCYSEEIGKNGTHHFHVFAYSYSPKKFETWKNLFPSAHIEFCDGTCEANRDYIRKSGKYEGSEKADTSIDGTFYEHGKMPSEFLRDLPPKTRIRELVKEGFDTDAILDMMPDQLWHKRQIDELVQHHRALQQADQLRDVKTVFITGPTGVGKSYGVFMEHGGDCARITHYRDNGVNFDAYNNQSVLVFEEFASQIYINEMLNYLDIYPTNLPARYCDRVAMYTRVYIISNLPLDKMYPNVQVEKPEVWEAFLRRISEVRIYDEEGNVTITTPKEMNLLDPSSSVIDEMRQYLD